MGFTLNHLQSWVVVIFFVYTTMVFAAENVTVDDQSLSIIYSPPGAWSQSPQNPLDFEGTHMLTQNPNATASFNFTGIAIYFLSPLWPYTVNTAVSLDSGPIALIDLEDHSHPVVGQGNETVKYHVVWNATGLANTQHNLLISVGAGQPYAILDGLTFTSATNTRISNATNTSNLGGTRGIVAFVIFVVFGLLGLLFISWKVRDCYRRRKRPIPAGWSDAPCISPNAPYISPIANRNGIWTADELYRTSWYNPRYQIFGMPAPPTAPSQPYYNGGYQNDSEIINSRQHQMTGRIPNRYEQRTALSTITEGSTPQMEEGRALLENTSASYQQSELEEGELQESETSHSISR